MAKLKRWHGEVLLFLLASPVLAVRAAVTGVRKTRFLAVASRTEICCECGSSVSLVGRWKCSCGFTYNGHLLQLCPVCGSLPCMVRCYACGVTTKLPEP
jgi:hypothetical protein